MDKTRLLVRSGAVAHPLLLVGKTVVNRLRFVDWELRWQLDHAAINESVARVVGQWVWVAGEPTGRNHWSWSDELCSAGRRGSHPLFSAGTRITG